MAEQYSSAVLGLGIDTRQFNKELASTSLRTQWALEKMKAGADAFQEKWHDATAGIKDTKRIISGILISQGFYAFSNVLVEGASAALSFAKNMETAAISMEYFVKGADKANKAAAFLREMNEFAARTPFSTEEALALSKYMQAVGVSMGTTKSFLQVITDTAAATGATEENLQRIVFGLGQMMTKGRIANEEIRQLANANIPIYEILREELGLTGAQISNIGKQWLDADKAVVAILRGLEKRYEGAADKISDTVTGMTDTIVDNLKIIGQSASANLYDALADKMTVLRDALDRYREIVVTQGSMGLFNQILLDIDATGELGNQILALIGNVRQLGSAVSTLYTEAKPLVNLFGRSLYVSISTVTITLTSLAKIADSAVDILNRLGITSGTTAEVISTLFIAYKATSWLGTLGQGAIYAASNLTQTALSMANILPASIRANTGVALLTAGLAGLLTMGLATFGIFKMINNAAAGLDVSGGGFSADYLAEMEKYQAEMAAYNEAIAKYQEDYNLPYTAIANGTDLAIDGLEEVEKKSKKTSKSVRNDWVAAFDEVYSIPDATGSTKDDETALPDFGALLTTPRFIFPALKVEELQMPKFDWADLYGGSAFSELPDKQWLATLLPGILLGAALSAGQLLAKKRQTDIAAKKTEQAADSSTSAAHKTPSILEDVDARVKSLVKIDAENTVLLKKIEELTEKLTGAVSREREFGTAGPSALNITKMSGQLELGVKELEKVAERVNELRASLGAAPIVYAQHTNAVEALRQANIVMLRKQLDTITHRLTEANQTAIELQHLENMREGLINDLRKIPGVTPTSLTDVGTLNYAALEELFNAQAVKVSEAFKQVFTGRIPALDNAGYYYDVALMQQANDAWKEFIYLADRLQLFTEYSSSLDTIGNNILTTLQGSRKQINTAFKHLLGDGSASAVRLEQIARSLSRVDRMAVSRDGFLKLLSKVDEQANELRDLAKVLDVASYENLAANAARDARRRAAEVAAAQQRAEMLEQQKKDRAAAEAARQQLIEARTGTQHVGSSLEMNARYKDAYYRINGNTEASALRLVEAAEDNTARLKELRAELRKTVAEYNEHRFFLDNHLDMPKHVDTPVELLPKALKESTIAAAEAKTYILGLVEELEAYGKSASKSAYAILGRQSQNAAALLGMANDSSAAWKAFKEAITSIIPSSNLLPTSLEALLSAGTKIPKAFEALAEAATLTSSSLMLTGTAAEAMLKGLGSFGADIPSSLATAYYRAGLEKFEQLLTVPVDFDTQIKAALGTYLEPIVKTIAAQSLVPEFGELLSGGFKAAAGAPLLVEIDSVMRIFGEAGRVLKEISNDIKTKSAKDMQRLYEASEYYAAGMRRLPAEILERIAPAQLYQLMAQATVMGTNMTGMSVFNRDFDYSAVDEALVERWKTLMHRRGLTDKTGGRIFSVDAVRDYAAITGNTGESAQELVGAYFERIIAPLLAPETGLDYGPLKHAFQQYILEFSDKALAALDIEGAAKSYELYSRLIASVIDQPNITNFLKAYVRINTEAGESIAALNFTPVLRSYNRMLGRHNKWLQNILKTEESFAPRAIGRPLQQAIDNLVTEYTTAAIKAADIDSAATLAAEFSTQMSNLAKAAEIYAAGGELDEAFTALFEGSKRSIEDMRLLRRALYTLANKTDLVNRLPMLMRTVIETTQGINLDLLSGAKIHANTLMGAGRAAEQLFDMLGISSTKAADVYINQLTNMHQIAARAADNLSAFNPETFGQLIPPIEALNITEVLQYTAGALKEGIDAGLYALSDDMAREFTEVISQIDVKTLADDFIGRLSKAAEFTFARFIADIETTGLLTASQGGQSIPEIVQVALYDTQEGKLYTWFVDYGNKNTEVLGRIREVLEVWRDKPDDILNTGKDILSVLNEVKGIVGDNLVTAYNGANFGFSGGAFDMRVIFDKMGEDFLKLGDDVMYMVSKTIGGATGTLPRFKLSDIYEIVTGGAATDAHDAGADVLMTAKVMQAVQDGTLEKIVASAASSGFEGGIKQSLLAAGSAFAQNSEGLLEPILEAVTDVTGTISVETTKAVEAVANAVVADTAKATATASQTIFDGAAETAAKATTSFTERLKTFWARMNEGWGGIGKAAKVVDDGIDLFGSFDELVIAAQKFEPFQIAFNKATAAMEAGLATPRTSWVVEATGAYNKAHKEYAKVSRAFYKNIIDVSADGLKGFENTGTLFTKAGELFNDGIGYMAYVVDPKTGALKLMNDTLLAGGSEIQEMFLKTATKATEGLKLSDEALKLAFQEYKLYTEGLKAANELSTAATAIKGAFEDVSNTFVLMGADGKVYYAGKAAAEAIEAAADTLSTSFASVSKKLVAGIGGFGILDAIGIAVATAMQHQTDIGKREELGYRAASYDDTGVLAALLSEGVDIGALLGKDIYKGLAEVAAQETASSITGGLATTALVAALPAGAVAGLAAAVVGGLVTAGIDLTMRATGGRTDVNLYYDDYIKALQRGTLVTEQAFGEMEASLGRTLEAEEREAITSSKRRALDYQLIFPIKDNNVWESDEFNRSVYGGKYSAPDDINKQIATELRVAVALGLTDAADLAAHGISGIGYVDTSLSADAQGRAAAGGIRVSDEQALAYLNRFISTQLVLGSGPTENTTYGGYTVQGHKGYGVATAGGGSLRAVSLNDLEAMESILSLIYEQGYGSGAVIDSVQEVIANNALLSKTVKDTYGNVVIDAYANFDNILARYNASTGSQYTRANADAIEGFSQQLIQQALGAYNAYNAVWLAQMNEQSTVDTTNRNVMAGDTSSILWNGSLEGLTKATLDNLATFGISLSESAIEVDTAITDLTKQTYVQLATDAEMLRNKLAGWTVDASSYAGLNLKELVVSAQDIEILAQAGIQINSDGSVNFMRAINEEITGAERTLDLKRGAIAKSTVKTLDDAGIAIDFDASTIDLTKLLTTTDAVSGALFALPDNIKSKINPAMEKQLAGLGKITDDGLFMITNTAVLRGEKTVAAYLNSLGDKKGIISGDVQTAFYNIDTLIKTGGKDLAANIIEWANGIIIPSPIKEEELSSEIRAAFAAIGVSFEKSGTDFLMVVNATGEHIRDGMTLIDVDTWNKLDKSIVDMLTDLGVTTRKVGNQVMVDLGGTFDNGIYSIVELFTEQPELWEQVPESIKTLLAEAGLVAEGGLFIIKSDIAGTLTEVADGWVVSWDSLEPVTRNALRDAGISVRTGVLKISEIVDDENIPELVDGQIAVPFAELPKEIQDALNATGASFEGKAVILEEAAKNALSPFAAVFTDTTETVVSEATTMAEAVAKAVTDALTHLNWLNSLDLGKTGGLFNKVPNTPGEQVKDANGNYWTPEYTAAGVIVAYHRRLANGSTETVKELPGKTQTYPAGNYSPSVISEPPANTADKILVGSELKSRLQVLQKAKGGAAAGVTLVGERGRELALLPDGTLQYVGLGGGEVVDLPAGSHVINNADTEAISKYVGSSRMNVRQLADGNAAVTVGESKESEAASKAIIDYLRVRTLSGLDSPEYFDNLTSRIVENIHVAIRGSTAALLENATSIQSLQKDMLGTQLQPIIAAVYAVSEDIRQDMSTASLRVMEAITASTKALQKTPEMEYSDYTYQYVADVINEAQQEWRAAVDDAQRAAAHEKAEAARALLGYSGGVDGSELIRLKGSAGGSLVTKDALYRAGEFGLNEAIIPLERPDVLAKVGKSIAGSMPVEQATLMRGAVGMQNAGISLPTPQPVYAPPPPVNTDALVQSVLESVLPAISNVDDSGQSRQNLNVGVLIADEQGLKMLERKLYDIRQLESSRRL